MSKEQGCFHHSFHFQILPFFTGKIIFTGNLPVNHRYSKSSKLPSLIFTNQFHFSSFQVSTGLQFHLSIPEKWNIALHSNSLKSCENILTQGEIPHIRLCSHRNTGEVANNDTGCSDIVLGYLVTVTLFSNFPIS